MQIYALIPKDPAIEVSTDSNVTIGRTTLAAPNTKPLNLSLQDDLTIVAIGKHYIYHLPNLCKTHEQDCPIYPTSKQL